MPPLKTYVVFISHAWEYGDQYDRIVGMLNNANNFYWKNCSVPKDDPVHITESDKKLDEAIREQIRVCNIALILGGMYAVHSGWIKREIELCGDKKPIVGIKPRGNKLMPKVVADAAKEVVGWNTQSIVDAIRRHAK